jgi:hypothetical protein
MAESARFRFGEINLSESVLPTPEELDNAIDDEFRVRGEKIVVEDEDPVELEEKGLNSYYSDIHDEYSFCQFTYVSDKENSATVREGDEVKVAPDNQPVQPLVFYFRNGQFAYEAKQGLVNHWIPQFIGSITNTEMENNYRFNNFPQDIMKEYYRSRDEISIFKFGSSEEEFNTESDLANALNELAEKVANQEFSGGNPPTNLKGLDIFDEAADKMHILKLRGAVDDGNKTDILSTGMKEINWDENDLSSGDVSPDEGRGQRAETMYRKLVPYLRKLR